MHFLVVQPTRYRYIFCGKNFLKASIPDPYKLKLRHVLEIRSDLVKKKWILLFLYPSTRYNPELIVCFCIVSGNMIIDIDSVVDITCVYAKLNIFLQFRCRAAHDITAEEISKALYLLV
jgi:hypothetical protein